MNNRICYRIIPENPNAHLFAVTVQFTPQSSAASELTLPAWIPGSYMIRDFARNIINLSATCQSGDNQAPATPLVSKIDKQSWSIANHSGQTVTVSYQVYAWDLSVRAAHLDQNHGFFNGSSVFLSVCGQTDRPCEIDIVLPDGAHYQQWQVATGLQRSESTPVFKAGRYLANNYDQLIDHPVEMGTFDHISFETHGITHYLIFTGKHYGDLERVSKDLQKLCAHHLDLFITPLDIREYWFLTFISDKDFGGLEHRNSTALICSRFDLPSKNYPQTLSDGYQTFLTLCSHEYFHTWNVKRIKPASFIPYQLAAESYTEQLWAYEGITSYYDDLSLVRTGTIDAQTYLLTLAKTLSRVYRGKGRFKQSVSESSFDAWTKFYKQDENAPNAIVSYYTKGSLIALCLDLMIRQASDQQRSLDDVMRQLWLHHGLTGKGTELADFINIIADIGGEPVSDFLQQVITSTADLPLAALLSQAGVELTFRQPTSQDDLNGPDKGSQYLPSLAISYQAAATGIQISQVLDDGAGQKAGLSAGDLLLAIDKLKVTSSNLDTLLGQIPQGSPVEITLFRKDYLMTLTVDIQAAEAYVAVLTIIDQDKAAAWLTVPTPMLS